MDRAWGRRSVSVGGGPHFETQQVIWLQAGPCYADIRVGFHPAADERCFTGRSGWDGARYRWSHHLDLESSSPAADDVGDLTWEDGRLVERGLFPTGDGAVTYEEVWVRLPGDGGPSVSLEAGHACLVRVGDHAITVVDERLGGGEFRACYRVFGAGGWSVAAVIGDDAAGLPGPDILPDWPVIHQGATEVAAT
jgi:hypothetical protein